MMSRSVAVSGALLAVLLLCSVAIGPQDSTQGGGAGLDTRATGQFVDLGTKESKATYLKLVGSEDRAIGGYVASGDFDGDGLADTALGLPYPEYYSDKYTGEVRVLWGASKGELGKVVNGTDRYDLSIKGASDDKTFGSGLCFGDFDADGYDDLAVCSPSKPGPYANVTGTGSVPMGEINIIFGQARQPPKSKTLEGLEHFTLHNNQTGLMIWGILKAGDLNGDGYDDLVIPMFPEVHNAYDDDVDVRTDIDQPADKIFVAYGGQRADLRTRPLLGPDNQTTVLGCNDVADTLSIDVCDSSGDGIDDLAVGYPSYANGKKIGCGRIDLFYGGPWFKAKKVHDIFADSNLSMYCPEEYGDLGRSIAHGDLNGDGKQDLFFNTWSYGDTLGNFVLFGSNRTGPLCDIRSLGVLEIMAKDSNEFYSIYSAAFGDLDGDGIDDLVLGVPYYSYQTGYILFIIPTFRTCGAVFIIPGSKEISDGKKDLGSIATCTVIGESDSSSFGDQVICADLDGDNKAELVVSDLSYDIHRDMYSYSPEGAVYFLYPQPYSTPQYKLEQPEDNKKTTCTVGIILLLVPVVLIIVIVLIVILNRRRKRLLEKPQDNTGMPRV